MSWVPRWASNLGTQLRQERVAGALVAEGRRGAMAGVHDGLGREAVEERADRLDQRVPVAERQVDAADRALKEDVPGEQRPVRVEREVARRMAGHLQRLEVDAGELERLVAA